MDENSSIIPDKPRKPAEEMKEESDNVNHNINQQDKPMKYADTTILSSSVLQSVLQNHSAQFALTSNILSEEVRNLGLIAISASVPDLKFAIPAIAYTKQMSNNFASNLSASLTAFVNSEAMCISTEAIKSAVMANSAIGSWLHSIDFLPIRGITEALGDFGFSISKYHKKLNDLYLQAMYDSKWFPYTGNNADGNLFTTISEILSSSRVSKNRVRRIDKAIFNYYSKKELMNLKRKWRAKELPSYMLRIMIQAVQAYNRQEYALSVSSLSTLWEGIIAEKANDSNDYRVSGRTRANLKQLVEENKFAPIFSSFCEEFIFYNCNSKDEVKQDVPGRHSIAHCWYNKYPSRKAALNAILFTDFLVELSPIDESKEKN